MDEVFKILSEKLGSYKADDSLLKELEAYGKSERVGVAVTPAPYECPSLAADGRAHAPWEIEEKNGEHAMKEILGEDYMDITTPEPPRPTILPTGSMIVPVRTVKRINVRELGSMRRFMEPDQINERMVSELMQPLLRQLDEMGLLDLQINHVNPDTLEYSISLNVLKNE